MILRNNINKMYRLVTQSRFVRSVCLVSLDALALLTISACLYLLLVGSCLLDDACYRTYYGGLQ